MATFNTSPLTKEAINPSEICQNFRKRISETGWMDITTTGQQKKRIYPKSLLDPIFTEQAIEELLGCCCACCASSHKEKDHPSGTLYNSYRTVLAALTLKGRIDLIWKFVDKEFHDEKVLERVLNRPLTSGELAGCITDDKAFVDDFCNKTQYQFFIPTITENPGFSFHAQAMLPINMKKAIGSGERGRVFEAEILPGYHNLPGFEPQQTLHVAIKVFKKLEFSPPSDASSSSDSGYGSNDYTYEYEFTDYDCAVDAWEREVENNHHFMKLQNKHILTMLTNISHQDEIIVYPLARMCLEKRMTGTGIGLLQRMTSMTLLDRFWNAGSKYPVDEMVRHAADLFSALHAMHAGQEGFCGGHLDVKPANILVVQDFSLALADLGQAHFQPGPAAKFILNHRQGRDVVYGAPEKGDITQAFDLWSMGAVLCELTVFCWGGPSAIQNFTTARRKSLNGDIQTPSFHKSGQVKHSVKKQLVEVERSGDRLLVGCVDVARGLLREDPAERFPANVAASLLLTLLGQDGQELPDDCHPDAKVLYKKFQGAQETPDSETGIFLDPKF
ncbi:kinase-like domain-containing protein [Sphaerosporella brunnea]|uniref:Kinase-like domain-containing protein n=1 Tax=Sphaerosporella brunnea TaxID=1250544 RepID=A0A5J5EI05_9PEZI|nr:kinase-like domain-containing protein [Sphaerosporella brunnea]